MDANNEILNYSKQSDLPFPVNSNFNIKKKQKPIKSAQEALENLSSNNQTSAINKLPSQLVSNTGTLHPSPQNQSAEKVKPQCPNLNKMKNEIKEEASCPKIVKDKTKISSDELRREMTDILIKKAQEGVTPFTKIENFFIALNNLESEQNFEALCHLYFNNPAEIFDIIELVVSKMGKGKELDECVDLLSKSEETYYLTNLENIQKKIASLFIKISKIDSNYKPILLKIIKKITTLYKKENAVIPSLSEKNLRTLCDQYHIRFEEGRYMYRFLKIHIRLWNASAKYQEIVKAIELNQGPIGFMTTENAPKRAIYMGHPEEQEEFSKMQKLQIQGCYSIPIHAVVVTESPKIESYLDCVMIFELTNAYQLNRFNKHYTKASSGGYMDPNFHDLGSRREKEAYQFAMAIEQIELDGKEICDQIMTEAIASKALTEDWSFSNLIKKEVNENRFLREAITSRRSVLEDISSHSITEDRLHNDPIKKEINEDQFLSSYGRMHIRSYVEDYLKYANNAKISNETKLKSFKDEKARVLKNDLVSRMKSNQVENKIDPDDFLQTWDE